jgi:hypothetical protein
MTLSHVYRRDVLDTSPEIYKYDPNVVSVPTKAISRTVLDVAACVPPPAFPRTNRSGALRRAPARSVLVVSEFAPLAATARASRQSSVSELCGVSQGQQTVVRRPHPKDPREAPPCPMLSHDRVGVASGFLGCLLIRSPPKYHCEIDSRHASLAVFRAFAKNRPTQARRTNTLPAHLPCSYEASFTARSPALSRPPPAFGRCARRLSVLPRRPPAPRAFPWSRTRRADCLFFLRAVVGWISRRRRAPRVLDDRFRGAVSRVVLITTEIRRFLRGEGRFAGGDGARSPAARADYSARATAFSIAPRGSRVGSAIRLLSGSCRGDRESTRVRRVDFGGRVRGLEDEDSSRRSNANDGRPVPPRARRDAEIIFSLCKISGTRRELSLLFFTGRCPFSVRSDLARGSFSETLSRPIDRAR